MRVYGLCTAVTAVLAASVCGLAPLVAQGQGSTSALVQGKEGAGQGEEDEGRRFADGFVLLTLPKRCRLDLSPALVSLAAARLKASEGLEQDLTRHIGDVDQKIGLFDRRVRLAHDLRLGIERLQD